MWGVPVFKDRKQFSALREASRCYTMLTRDHARVESRIKSFDRSRGVPCSGEARCTGRAFERAG